MVDQKWSSVSEQIADFVTLLEPQIELDTDTAQNLLNGIDYATGDFMNPRTSYLAFEVAGILMKKGAIRQRAQSISVNLSNSYENSNDFFPPIPPVQQQPVQPIQQQQPIQPQPIQSMQQQQPMVNQQSHTAKQPSIQKQTPPDWLTPKVYKGSTVL